MEFSPLQAHVCVSGFLLGVGCKPVVWLVLLAALNGTWFLELGSAESTKLCCLYGLTFILGSSNSHVLVDPSAFVFVKACRFFAKQEFIEIQHSQSHTIPRPSLFVLRRSKQEAGSPRGPQACTY